MGEPIEHVSSSLETGSRDEERQSSSMPQTNDREEDIQTWEQIVPDEWTNGLKCWVKPTVYRFFAIAQKAISVFGNNGCISHQHYKKLRFAVTKLWTSWLYFASHCSLRDIELQDSPIYFDFSEIVRNIHSPIGVDCRSRFRVLRQEARDLIVEVNDIRGILDEATVRFSEDQGRNPAEEDDTVKFLFEKLPETANPTVGKEVLELLSTLPEDLAGKRTSNDPVLTPYYPLNWDPENDLGSSPIRHEFMHPRSLDEEENSVRRRIIKYLTIVLPKNCTYSVAGCFIGFTSQSAKLNFVVTMPRPPYLLRAALEKLSEGSTAIVMLLDGPGPSYAQSVNPYPSASYKPQISSGVSIGYQTESATVGGMIIVDGELLCMTCDHLYSTTNHKSKVFKGKLPKAYSPSLSDLQYEISALDDSVSKTEGKLQSKASWAEGEKEAQITRLGQTKQRLSILRAILSDDSYFLGGIHSISGTRKGVYNGKLRNIDWMLVKVESSRLSKHTNSQNSPFALQPGEKSSPGPIGQLDKGDNIYGIGRSSGPHLVGQIIEKNTYVKLEHWTEGTYEYRASFFGSPGYSGALIFRDDGCCVGHVWGRHAPTPQVYISPILQTFSDIAGTLKAKVVKLAREEDIEMWLQSQGGEGYD